MANSVLVLGGGIGGITVANQLKKLLGREGKITVVDKSPEHVFQPSFLSVLAGKRQPQQIKRSFAHLERKTVNFINGEVKEIQPERNLVKVDNRELSYDYLVIALGAELNMDGIPGLEQAAINLYSLDGILQAKEEINKFTGGDIVLLIPSQPYKCPAAPYETVFLLDAEFRRKKIRNKVNISVYTVEPLPMGTAGPQIGQAIKDLLKLQDIDFNPEKTVVSVNPANKEIAFADEAKKKTDMLITIPPHQTTQVVKKAGLTNEAGWIPVDKHSLKTKFGNVYAIGDITAIPLPGRYKPDKPLMLPKAGVFAYHQGLVVAANIASLIQGKKESSRFNGQGACFLELGNGRAGFATGSFFNLPQPSVKMKNPSRLWHLYKVLVEKYWFWRWL